MTIPTVTNETIAGVADLKAGYTLGNADVMILKALAAELLAVREAQPVAVIRHVEIGGGKTGCHATLFYPLPAGTELFTAPPAPAAIANSECPHVWEARPIDGNNSSSSQWVAVCQFCCVSIPVPTPIPSSIIAGGIYVDQEWINGYSACNAAIAAGQAEPPLMKGITSYCQGWNARRNTKILPPVFAPARTGKTVKGEIR